MATESTADHIRRVHVALRGAPVSVEGQRENLRSFWHIVEWARQGMDELLPPKEAHRRNVEIAVTVKACGDEEIRRYGEASQ